MQKTSYEMRISDWSSDVCSSDLVNSIMVAIKAGILLIFVAIGVSAIDPANWVPFIPPNEGGFSYGWPGVFRAASRSEEHTSELQSLMRISYAVFCLKKKIQIYHRKDMIIQ